MNAGKRIAALLMCIALVLSTAACTGGENSSTSSTGSTGSGASSSKAETSETGAGNKSDWFEGKDFSEKQVISLASVQIEDGRDYNMGDDLVKWWSENFNIEWDITSLTFENWAERLRIWINSDDMPDMCVWNYVHGEAQNYADQGLVKMLPEDWK